MEDIKLLNKKFMLIAIFIVSLFAISAVSASELNTTDEMVISHDLNDGLISEDSRGIASISDEDLINAGDKGTFTDLQNMINNASVGSTISLEKDYFYDDGFDTEGIHTYCPLVIEGNGHTIDALGKSRIFDISDSDIVLNNIIFCNGYSDSNGGALLFTSEDVIVVYYGGYAFGDGSPSINNCTFVNNVAEGEGGAIYDCMFDEEYRSQLVDCHFVNNSAKDGGIISTCAFIISKCTFKDNFGDDIIDCYYDSDLADCLFVNNSAGRIISGYRLDVVRTTFNSNSGDTIIYYKSDGQSEVKYCLFSNNSAVGIKGGNAANCTFINNSASGISRGNAVNCYFVNNSASGIFTGNAVNCTFIGNSAEYGGAFNGGFYTSWTTGEDLDVEHEHYMDRAVNCTFIGNSAEYGGAIYDAVAVRCTFINNSAEYGGAIYDSSAEDCIFIDNSAKWSGVIAFDDLGSSWFNERQSIRNIIMANCNIQNSDLTDYYGIYVNGGDLVVWSQVSDKIVVKISGKTYVAYNKLYDGNKVLYNISDLSTGIYDAKISYSGDSNNKAFEINVPIYIKPTTEITSTNVTKYYGGFQKYTVILTENGNALVNKDVKITVGGNSSNVKTDSKGQASVNLDLGVGEYDASAVYGEVSTSSKIAVKSTLTVADAAGIYLNSKVGATFLDANGKALASKPVTFKVGSKTYSATTDSKGVATANVDLGVGNYNVFVVNPVNNEQKTFKLVISKAKSSISLTSGQNKGVTTLTASLNPSVVTGNVIFNVNGKERSVAVKSGKAVLTLDNLDAGNYTVTAFYNGDSNLNASTSNTVTFSVADVYPILTAKDVTKTYGTSTKLVVYLKDNKGNAIANAYVKVVMGMAVKNIKTNANGQATLAISNAPGSYNAKISYKTAQTTAKITIKKATPKITAKAKTFKKSVKTKMYTVKLNVNQKVKVAIKVNKKTYYAYTNAKGQAAFKITKLTKKGKYTATVSSIANKCYNKAKSVNVKITVK